ncbi:MAG: PilZ domain-containing protein [Deltaproteobacteria bacterium]|nr:MAG: PilZ domain-containing protein [Deltaproteobacteria bacterium]
MAELPKILLVEADRDPMPGIATRLVALGTDVVRVASVEDAIQKLDEHAPTTCVVFFPTQRPAAELKKLLKTVRRARRRTRAAFVGVGERPNVEQRKLLESAGVETCLAEPIGDTQLRFALNQAGFEPDKTRARRGVRAPTAIVARIVTATGEREALVYSLSAGGAYLETDRPTMAGGRLQIDLPLPGGTVTAKARALYHNVLGNLRQENLAVGMGVEFVDMDAGTRAVIADYVDACLESQTGRKPKKRPRPTAADAPPAKERRRFPRLDFLMRDGRPRAREKPEKAAASEKPRVERARTPSRPEPVRSAAEDVLPDSEPPAAPRPAPSPADKENKVVVRCRDGRLIKGHTFDFMPNKDMFHVVNPDDPSDVIELSSSEPKAIFFVKSFDGDGKRGAPKTFGKDDLRGVPGLKIKVCFQDGEVLYGTTHGYQPRRKGFFVFPADGTSNNERVYVNAASTDSVETWT